jgi:flagellar hook-associated protein 2
MATISSIGIGSGLDVESIVTQLVALEKQPLTTLTAQATTITSQVTAMADVKSKFASLADVATRISAASAWVARTAASSNTSAATISVTSSAAATSFTLDVDALATKQSVSSPAVTAGSYVGEGTMTFRLGTWSGGAFSAASGSADISVTATATDTVATLAAKINAANPGVVATAFFDGTQDRLLLASKSTGAAAGFRVQVTDTGDSINTDNAGLSRFAFDPETGAFGMASAGITTTYGQDAKARINGLAVTSSTNTLTGNMAGVTVELKATTTTGYGTGSEVKNPATMSISEDVTVAVKNIGDFVTAYNNLYKALADLTKYDAATKTASLFQGDSTVLGMQSVLRSMQQSVSVGSAYSTLSSVGVERQLDGSLTMNTAKLSTAANNGSELQKLFTTNNSENVTNGFALKFASFASGALASSGAVSNKEKALQSKLDVNTKEQTKVNDRAAATEARLRKTYSALDTKMASLNALSTYVSQQVTIWNKSTG